MEEPDKIVERLKTEHNDDAHGDLQLIIQLVESILSLVHSLIEDVAKVNNINSGLSVLNTKFEYLTNRLIDFEKKSNCSGNHAEITNLKDTIKKLENALKDVDKGIQSYKDEAVKEKKEQWINHGKLLVTLTLLLAVVLYLVEKKFIPAIISKFF